LKIVVLEAASLGKNIELDHLKKLGDVVVYQTTTENQVSERIADADIIVVNKVQLNSSNLGKSTNLKLITATSTGVNFVDLAYVNSRGIKVANIKGYSTQSVAQHTLTLLLCLMEKLNYYYNYVKSKKYVDDISGEYYNVNYHEIYGKTWGIVGMGAIGKKVAELATAFGAHVIYYSVSGQNRSEVYERVDLDTLLTDSDIISIHTPLNDKSMKLFTYESFKKMKPSAIFINVARGAIVDEYGLKKALQEGIISAAGIDVFCHEPMNSDCPLLSITDGTKLVMTPHIGWASVESRQRSIDEIQYNIEAFLRGKDRNIVQ